jgi:hypothetical protein
MHHSAEDHVQVRVGEDIDQEIGEERALELLNDLQNHQSDEDEPVRPTASSTPVQPPSRQKYACSSQSATRPSFRHLSDSLVQYSSSDSSDSEVEFIGSKIGKRPLTIKDEPEDDDDNDFGPTAGQTQASCSSSNAQLLSVDYLSNKKPKTNDYSSFELRSRLYNLLESQLKCMDDEQIAELLSTAKGTKKLQY